MKEEEKMEFKEKAIIEQFSKRIKHIRKRRHMTQAEFSKSLGITQRGLQYYEKGERLPEMSLFCHICLTLNVSADYLLGFSDKQIPENEKNNLSTADSKKPDPMTDALRELGLS